MLVGSLSGFSIAFAIRSVDRTLQDYRSLSTRLIAHYKTIALVIHSVDRTLQDLYQDLLSPSLFAQLIAHYKTIALVIPKGWSVDRTLQDYRAPYPVG